ncbi:ABC transporter ATP-binding protein/permease [Glaciimonas immobilis]|uniref:Putative ATP-binding cassette transporter n=1 Tax=Glaciimonas immobilis TaxID=728004 RepID=A0A840RV20_9BURK|nr:ABC transporter ATP-binding protein/permease [Glaciimonas immobilis]KAF3997409.1 ABC transporter ATP-binding protein/permease [Glaciimonas immobilis]MBB5200928.1 putative ATP-binding cassette transporter [Glaciimonas immobilis]
MDWNNALLESLIWISKAFIISIICLSLIVIILARFTIWGRQFRRLTWAFFSPTRSKKPLLWLAGIVFLTLFSVRMNVLFSFWSNGLYSALQKLDAKVFWTMVIIFSILATVHVVRALINFYVRQAFLIHWRVWLTNNLVERWLSNQAYHRTQFVAQKIDNPDQRIQQDVEGFVSSSLLLSMGVLDSVVSLFSFSFILWGLSGALGMFGVEIPRAMVFLVYIYVLIATIFAVRVGRPLMRLSFMREKFNADFRYALVRVREYAESIAFFRGENVERSALASRFSDIVGNMWAIISRSLKFQGLNLVVSQIAVVFPLIIQAPRFFSKQITLGDMMQTAQAFGQVQDSLSFFRNAYDDFAGYRAIMNRLTGYLDSIDAALQLPGAQIGYQQNIFIVDGLTVKTPDQLMLVENLNLNLPPMASLLIRGRSGVGKTTLLRAVSGLWPYVEGNIARPDPQHTLFLPQKPYLPLGTLRTALHYPNLVRNDDGASEVLRKCQLSHLIPRLDDDADWSQILSLGEQQRLAIGRVLLSRPQVVFLDEASSAMDEGLEHAMYQLIRDTLPQVIMVSVGHRSSLAVFHAQELMLFGAGKWRLGAMEGWIGATEAPALPV